jgi:heptosyltransferase-2
MAGIGPNLASVVCRPLIARLPNWVGEAALAYPTLVHLENSGYQLHLVGKPWARELFAGRHWPVCSRADSFRGVVAQLRGLKARLAAGDPTFDRRINTVLFPKSHSSAWEARVAGLRPVGHAYDYRSYLLSKRVRFSADLHVADSYWQIGAALLPSEERGPRAHAALTPSQAQIDLAAALRRATQIPKSYVVLCPFSGPGDDGRKRWPGFPELARRLARQQIKMLVCPSPDEVDEAHRQYPMAKVLADIPLGVYSVLMRDAWCTIANDTGPGHLAASAGGRLVSILGPHFRDRWAPVGPLVKLLHHRSRWSTIDEVVATLPSTTSNN